MPPKIKITKQQIIDISFEITRKEGMEALNARKIAKELNCSVQPIFSNFNNMDDLKEVLHQKISNYYYNYLIQGELSYKEIGFNYVKFAREEKELFKAIIQKQGNLDEFFLTDQIYLQYVEKMLMDRNLTKEQALVFHKKMWLFIHGLASLIAYQDFNITDQEIGQYLTQQHQALINWEKEYGKGNRS